MHEAVLDALADTPARPWEVGGWLMGYWSAERDALAVTHHTPPASRGTGFGVTISGRGHRKHFDAIFDETHGRATFIGDWHTHPAGPAHPSHTDLGAMAQLADDADYGTPCPLIAIVTTGRFRHRTPEIRWWLRPADGLVRELSPITYAGPRVHMARQNADAECELDGEALLDLGDRRDGLGPQRLVPLSTRARRRRRRGSPSLRRGT